MCVCVYYLEDNTDMYVLPRAALIFIHHTRDSIDLY